MVRSITPTRPPAAELERPTPTARRLAEASLSPNTRPGKQPARVLAGYRRTAGDRGRG